MARLLRYKGKDTALVDPYWDFEHEPGDAYDMEALRLWRARVFLSGPRSATVRLRLERGTVGLPPPDHVLRYTTGPDLSPESYVPIASRDVLGAPPMLVLAVNLTRLAPGEYVLTTEVLGSEQEDKEMRFRVTRRPFYTFDDPIEPRETPPRRSLSVRSSTGLQETREATVARLAAAHAWKAYRNTWASLNATPQRYARVEPVDVVAVTLFRDDCTPERTRWHTVASGAARNTLGSWNQHNFDTFYPPSAHASPPPGIGFGLPFPTLVGLPRQPGEDGQYRSPTSWRQARLRAEEG